ncbi:MAG: dihydropteroate synthase DHPS, partial [Halanaerobium sp. MSAO_Bac5]
MVEKLFITGKLAYPALNNTLKKLDLKYDYQIVKLPITVAALMDSSFICKKLKKYKGELLENAGQLEIIIPGRSQAEISKLEACFNNKKLKFRQGPDEIMDLPEFLGKKKIKVNLEAEKRKNKILAEINAAALLPISEIVKKAEYYKKSGADIIDLGCVNGREFPHLEKTINILKE